MDDEGRRGDDLERPLGVEECKERVYEKFIETGLKELCLRQGRQRASHQSWSTTMRDLIIDRIKKEDPNDVNISRLIEGLVPTARESFPAGLKAELLGIMFEAATEFFIVEDVDGILSPDPPDKPETCEADKTLPSQEELVDAKPDPDLGNENGATTTTDESSQSQSVVILTGSTPTASQKEEEDKRQGEEDDDIHKDKDSSSISEDGDGKEGEDDEDSESYYAEDES